MLNKKKVVVVGGGTAGWVSAAALVSQLGEAVDVTLVESPDIATIGVGEASIPPMRTFHKRLGIDEQSFMRATGATFKLGIQFENWRCGNDSYIHSFGKTGKDTWMTDFLHFWLLARRQGDAEEYGEYCKEWLAAKSNKFVLDEQNSLNYAYHLDAGKYASFLAEFSIKKGVAHCLEKVNGIEVDKGSGNVKKLHCDSGKVVEGDLFIDCSGFKGLLINGVLRSSYIDWSHWLGCDRAVAVQTPAVDMLPPYTRSAAHQNGWSWQIPLQARTGNGVVYSSAGMSDDAALSHLQNFAAGEFLNEPKVIRFNTGRRQKHWVKNVVAIGLSGGFIEPLESTSIHLAMTGIMRLLHLFPSGEISPHIVNEYNRQTSEEIESVRDFIILHYKVTEREDSDFWRYCRSMDIPDSLAHRIDLFKSSGLLQFAPGELFHGDSWLQVMLGQGLFPDQNHALANILGEQKVQQLLAGLHRSISSDVSKMPSHKQFIRSYCAE